MSGAVSTREKLADWVRELDPQVEDDSPADDMPDAGATELTLVVPDTEEPTEACQITVVVDKDGHFAVVRAFVDADEVSETKALMAANAVTAAEAFAAAYLDSARQRIQLVSISPYDALSKDVLALMAFSVIRARRTVERLLGSDREHR